MIPGLSAGIPYSMEQGISEARTGISDEDQGISAALTIERCGMQWPRSNTAVVPK
jgi:hypothetical protein